MLVITTGCLQTRQAASLEETVGVLADGDLPTVDAKTAHKLISESVVPVAIMLTAKWCSACKSVQGDFWRTTRKKQNRFIGVVLDVDQNEEFYRLHGEPPLPTVILYEKGGERWTVTGVVKVRTLLSILEKNTEGFITRMTAAAAPTNTSTARVFLVAASADSANFAQEIADQYAYWKGRGLKDEEIACYYSVPNFEQYWADKDQFKSLSRFVQTCQKAELPTIEAHWQDAAKKTKSWMYLYVTSHGAGKKNGIVRQDFVKKSLPSDKKGNLASEACNQFFSPHIVFDSVRTNRLALDSISLYGGARPACEAGESPAVMLTEKRLSQMLAKVSDKTQVIVALQACYSGAVIPAVLKPNMTVLAAASADRMSFGCNVDGDRTVYGQELLGALESVQPNPTTPSDWEKVYDYVSKRVIVAEKELGIQPGGHSEPVIMSGATSH